jgi:hypothetical protein
VKTLLFLATAAAAPVPEPGVHHAPPAPQVFAVHEPYLYPTAWWFAAQLVPSPELVVGRQRAIDPLGNVDTTPNTAFGVRWQLTPLLWSFGVHRSQTGWRTFVVDPIARQSGSLELSTSFEYIGGWVDRLLVRPGLRVYLPLAHRGEYLSTSIGTSVYRYDGALRVAYEAGVYFLSGVFGFQFTFAPTHDPLATIATFRIRYF